MDRSNGVIVTRTIVADGPTMDAFFKKYGLDPNKDMIVCARGSGSILNQARCWYTLRYWGVPKRNVAFLDGDFGWQVNRDNPNAMEGSDFAASAATPPMDGKVSVRDLPEDNFALIATIEDMFAVATTSAQNDTTDGVLVWDARGMNQYSAGEQVEMGQSGCAGSLLRAARALQLHDHVPEQWQPSGASPRHLAAAVHPDDGRR
jgi:3-mercaptopyruvate sulfurtransferase SseA